MYQLERQWSSTEQALIATTKKPLMADTKLKYLSKAFRVSSQGADTAETASLTNCNLRHLLAAESMAVAGVLLLRIRLCYNTRPPPQFA